MTILETERLVICQLSVNDAAFIFELLNSPSWLKFIGDRGVKTIEDAEKYLKNGPVKSYAQNGFGLYLVKLKVSNNPIGMCGLIKRDALEDVDIGFAFLPAYEKRGYGFESASAILAHSRATLGLKRIVGITIAANHSSIHLLEKLGLSFEKKIFLPGDEEELMLYGSQ